MRKFKPGDKVRFLSSPDVDPSLHGATAEVLDSKEQLGGTTIYTVPIRCSAISTAPTWAQEKDLELVEEAKKTTNPFYPKDWSFGAS